jgi:putative transposase
MRVFRLKGEKRARHGRQKYTDEHVINILREGEGGARTGELCRKYGVSDATYHRCKAKCARLTLSELKRLKSLEAENHRLKQIVADHALDNRVLKDLLSKNECPGRGE